ncbi:MAG: sirohydrochlorin cobaltochelatase [Deltaproteobacteria bacterium]|nr:sirohydrochlorin cobaltochelatase [Deltaproteobacteria bacterium]
MSKASCLCGIILLFFCFACPALAGHSERPAKKGILLVAFGTTVPEATAALEHLDAQVKARFPGLPVHWAYSSRIVRDKLASTGVIKDSPATALAKMMDEGFTHVAVQSLHTIPGEEFHGLQKTVSAFTGMPKGMDQIEVGMPLLASHEDMQACAKAIMATLPRERKAGEAVVLMGHGTHHPGNIYYPALQYYLNRLDPLILVGTVEGAPSLDDVRAELKKRKVRTVYLRPLMSVAGDHAMNDMAGDEDDSWKSVLTKDGLACVPVLRGTAASTAFTDIWIDHLQHAVERLH